MLGLTRLTDSLIEDEEIDVAKHASNSMMMVEVLQKLESALSTLPTSSELLPVSRLYKFFGDAGVSLNYQKNYLFICQDQVNYLQNNSRLMKRSQRNW